MRTLVAASLVMLAAPSLAQSPAPQAGVAPRADVVLAGSLDRAAHQTYREVPFEVPAGVTALTVEFEYSGREERTVIDLGLADPNRFRGASGGNKSRFTLAESYATPSYLPGPIVPGTWRLLLGIPNIRQGARSDYVARISFERGAVGPRGFAQAPLSTESRWYRGDFHAHSGQSDGSCASQAGRRIPCPLHMSVEAAAARGLDFFTMSEHNATSHHGPMLELQPYYDRLLLVPGRELTTFFGHANMFGATAFVDFRVGSPSVPDVNAMLGRAAAMGGLISVNHPTAPSGENCMGCGWAAGGTDWRRVQAIEVVNGGSVAAAGGLVESPLSGIPFWEALLNRGHRLTAIGGSDNHDVQRDANAPGLPTTVVHARELSVPAVLEGVRAGRVFIDVEGTRTRTLELSARAGGRTARMGEALAARRGTRVDFTVEVGSVEGAVELVSGGPLPTLADPRISAERSTLRFSLRSDGRPQWVRVNVRDAAGKLILIGNPIYLNAR